MRKPTLSPEPLRDKLQGLAAEIQRVAGFQLHDATIRDLVTLDTLAPEFFSLAEPSQVMT